MRFIIAFLLSLLLLGQHNTYADSCPTQGCVKKYVLALSWQPAFCETNSYKKECKEQTKTDYEASNFTLHGLWPDQVDYCDVAAEDIKNDKIGNWAALPPVAVDAETKEELKEVMPGVKSYLDRHEWVKHGTCDGRIADDYYDISVDLLKDFNASEVRYLFAKNIGKTISLSKIKTAFEKSFGYETSSSFLLKCRNNLATEIRLKMKRPQPGDKLADVLISSGGSSCSRVVVDAVGVNR